MTELTSPEAVQRTTIDGVEVVWVDSGRPTLSASLVFRAGYADEALARSGRCHLLEHVTLHSGIDRTKLYVNGSVTSLLTSFDLAGDPAEVAAALTTVCEQLADPDEESLSHEKRVLDAERATQERSILGRALALRYGASGPGILAWGDLSISNATLGEVRALAATRFTRGNAALALDGPPPAGLRLPLPAGPRLTPAPDAPLPDFVARDLPFPAGFTPADDYVAVTGLAASVDGAQLGASVWRRRVRSKLSTVVSPRSNVQVVQELVGRELVIGLIVQARPARAGGVLSVIRDELAGLVEQGPTAQELADVVRFVEVSGRHGDVLGNEPTRQVRAGLVGLRPRSIAERVSALAAITPAEVASALAELQRTQLIQVPPGTDRSAFPDVTWTPTNDSPPDASATTFRAAGPRRWLDKTAATLHLGASTLHYRTPDETVTLSLPHLAAMVVFDDGGSVLINRDGDSLRVEPTLWRNSARLAALWHQVPDDRVVRVHGRPSDEIPRPPKLIAFYNDAVRRWCRR